MLMEKQNYLIFNNSNNNRFSSNSNRNDNYRDVLNIFKNNKVSSNALSIEIEIKINTVDSYINELLYFNSFLIDSFINQRKMFRYYRAATELEEQILSEEEFEKIEKSCVINLRNESSRNLKDKIIYLYESIESKYSEELEYMNDDDLADILGISKYNLKPLLKKA